MILQLSSPRRSRHCKATASDLLKRRVRGFVGAWRSCADEWCRAEAAIALRQRLNETVEQLDALRKEHAELEVKFQAQSKELTIAKSDRKSRLLVIGAPR